MIDVSKEQQKKSHVSLSITKYVDVGDTEPVIEETIWTIPDGAELVKLNPPNFNLNGDSICALRLQTSLTRFV